MIPLKDDNPTRGRAWVNYALIAACIAAFAWEVTLGRHLEAAIYRFGLVPAVLTGAARLPATLAGVPPWLTVFTSMFLHGSVLHLLGNLLYLWIFGDNIEDRFGHRPYLLFYVLCGIAAALAQALPDPHSQVPMVGASGAISGVLGAYALLYPRVKVHVIVPVIFFNFLTKMPALAVLGLWFLLQLASQLFLAQEGAGVAFRAHVGGFVAGLVLAPLFLIWRRLAR